MTTLRLNLDWLMHHSREGTLRDIYTYSVVNHLTRGVGHMLKSRLVLVYGEFTGLSKRTVYTHLKNCIGLYEKDYKDGTHVCVVSKEVLARSFKKRTEKFSERQLRSYRDFQAHFIRLVHLKLQGSFRFCYKKIGRNFESLLHRGEISEFAYPSEISKVGCSIRKVQEHTGIRYETIQKALRHVTEKVANLVCRFNNYQEFRKAYSTDFFIQNPKYTFRKHGRGIVVLYKLGSVSKYDRRSVGGLLQPLTIDPKTAHLCTV